MYTRYLTTQIKKDFIDELGIRVSPAAELLGKLI
jgi:hypothetical protein